MLYQYSGYGNITDIAAKPKVIEKMDEFAEPQLRRGTALLIVSMVFVATSFAFIVLPRTFAPPELSVRVAVIDSGITKDALLESRVVAEKSFILHSNGYSISENDTTDSSPSGNFHGTFVARLITEQTEHTAIINAKVITSSNIATIAGIIQAIRWAVTEQDCDVINLSLGRSASSNDEMKAVIEWTFQQGVVIVAAAGNNGQYGVSGSSIESPAFYKEVIAVSAVDDLERPFHFSGRGPLLDRTLKPDISAKGYYSDGRTTFYGTSFAAPIVSAGAASLIDFCLKNSWKWTPGMIKATLLASAKYIGYEPWEIGAGIVDIDTAKRYLDSAEKVDNLPMMVWIAPDIGPFDFERWFVNTSYHIRIPVFTSSECEFYVTVAGSGRLWVGAPSLVFINQTGEFSVSVNVISGEARTALQAQVILQSAKFAIIWTQFNFDMSVPLARVAFDFSHTPWHIDSVYGQFRTFYETITGLGIAVEEIRSTDELILENLKRFDAVILLDPCAWAFEEKNGTLTPLEFRRFASNEIDEYIAYWEQGGNLMVTGGNNDSMDIEGINELLSEFEIQLNFDRVPPFTFFVNGIASSEEITAINENHPVTDRVDSFDYNGGSLNVSTISEGLAWAYVRHLDSGNNVQLIIKPVLVAQERSLSNSKLIVTGTNFFLDNWALNDLYHADDNSKLVIQSIFWLVGLI